MGKDRAKKKHEREIKRRQHRRDVRIDASLRADPDKKPKFTSWKGVIEGIVSETAELLGIYNDLKRFYKARLKFSESQYAADPNPVSEARLEEYKKFGDEINDLNDSVRALVTLTASIEDKEDTRERMEYFFDHMDEINDSREKFASVMTKMQTLDEHFVEDMNKLNSKLQNRVEVTEEAFPEEETTESVEEEVVEAKPAVETETTVEVEMAPEEVIAEVRTEA